MATLNYKTFTLGVEEEYMVIDPVTYELKSHEQKIVHEGQKVIKDKVKAEMHQAVVEVGVADRAGAAPLAIRTGLREQRRAGVVPPPLRVRARAERDARLSRA